MCGRWHGKTNWVKLDYLAALPQSNEILGMLRRLGEVHMEQVDSSLMFCGQTVAIFPLLLTCILW